MPWNNWTESGMWMRDTRLNQAATRRSAETNRPETNRPKTGCLKTGWPKTGRRDGATPRARLVLLPNCGG